MIAVRTHEGIAARAALAAIALHALDDAFVHPEPGTAAGDHLAGGLVPAAVAVALAVAWPRLRAGWQGVLALAFGALALVGGIGVSARHVAIDRLAGDDLTGLLAGVAGAVLVAVGVVTLWRSRRRGGPRARRWTRRALLGVAGLLVGLFVVVPIGLAILGTHKARAPVAAADLGRPYERVTLTTSDGLRLAAWYVPSRNRAAIIAFPGRKGPVEHARLLVRHGYGVLLLDRRGEGESQGDFSARGWNGEPDLVAALRFLRERRDVDPGRIGGLGLSVGGELLLQTAARHPELRAVVSEGAGIRSIEEQLHQPGIAPWRRWLSPSLVETAATTVLADTGRPPDLVDLMPRIEPRAVLLIRALDGNEDEVLNRVYRDAAGPTAQLWTVPDGGHTGALRAHPREYETRVVQFLDRALLR